MEKANREKIKEVFLAAFVLVSVGLIFTLWVNAFSEKDVEIPYFYRGVPELSQPSGMTTTAIVEQSISGAGTATSIPTNIHPAATPTSTPDLLLNFTPESDN